MIFFNLTDWNRLSQQEKNSLTFLRGLRDAFADDFITGEFTDEIHQDCVESVIQYEYGASAYYTLRKYCEDLNHAAELEKLHLFRLICNRIAKIERLLVGWPIPSNLVDA